MACYLHRVCAIDDLEEAGNAALADPPGRMPAVMVEAQRLMGDPDPEVRTRAVGIAWFAIRQMFKLLAPSERVALADAVSRDLEAAIAAGLVPPIAMLGNALRGVIQTVRERGGVIDYSLL